MTSRAFGRTGRLVPRIGLGTWHVELDREGAVRALLRGFELGLTHVDTAEMYGAGEAERIVGAALAAWSGRREDLFVVSKVLPSNASRAGTIAAAERSLERLGLDALDLYLLHWAGRHPLEDTVAAFEELVERGLIRSYGVSNFDDEELRRVVRIAGPGRVACNQVLYHLTERAIEHRVLPACEELDVALVAYCPLGGEPGAAGGFPAAGDPGFDTLAAIAHARGATPRQIALAFLTRNERAFAIPKTSSVRHAEELAGALTLELGAEERARLDAAFPLGPDAGPLPMV